MSTRMIAFDETGNFENRKSGVRFIGGYFLDVDKESDLNQEESDIEEFLKNFCEDFNKEYLSKKEHDGIKTCYPESLHGGSKATFFQEVMQGSKVISKPKLREIDIAYIKSGSALRDEFNSLLEKKTIEHLRKKGAKLFIYLDPYINETLEEISDIKSNILDLDTGANFYERMATLALYNQVFDALEEPKDTYIFKLATRTLPQNNNSNSNKKMDETYDVYSNLRGEKKATITNTSTYKTAMTSMLYERNINDAYANAKYIFDVCSINYSIAHKGKKTETTPSLYLADIVCNYIRNKIQKKFKLGKKTTDNRITGEGLQELIKEFKEQSQIPIQIRIYDECDLLFRHMVDYVKRNEIALYYAAMYDMRQMTGIYKDFYLNHWVSRLEAYFKNKLKQSDSYKKNFLSKVPEFLVFNERYMKKSGGAYEKGLYIAKKIAAIIEKQTEYRERGKTLFELYSIILRGYNHRGSLKKTKQYIDKCEIYKSYVGLEKYIEHVLRVLVYYFNSLEYDKVLERGCDLEKTVRELKKVYESCYQLSSSITQEIANDASVSSGKNVQFDFAGKLYSSIGQAYGFLQKYEQAETYFKDALNEFSPGSVNSSITMSYLLQLYISNNKKEEYEEQAKVYFGTGDLKEQMKSAAKFKDGGFAFLIFVKAIRTFYAADEAYILILDELVDIVRAAKNDTVHPWELIYKNLYEALMIQRAGCLDIYEDIKQKALNGIEESDATIKIIQLNAKFAFASEEEIRNAKDNYFAREYLSEEEIAICEQFRQVDEELSFEELKKWFEEKMVYSYN